MFDDVKARMKRRNDILFSRESACLQPLLALMSASHHRALVLWALECALIPLERFEAKFPGEERPGCCLERSRAWAEGKIRMREARKYILDAHAVAKEIQDAECVALCHAIGHAGATVHTGRHAIGLPIYELTAIVRQCRDEDFSGLVEEKIAWYMERLMYWIRHADDESREWAGFLSDG